MSQSISRFLTVMLGAAVLFGCENNPNPTEEIPEFVEGECATVFGGDICTWGVTLAGNVVEFGATVPMTTIQDADMEAEMTWPPYTNARVPVPSVVAEATGVDHLGINWEAHGHPPGPYLTPHFDFHFNTVSGESIEAIDCSNLDKPEVVPTGYVLPDIEIEGLGMLEGLCVPEMGMHALSEVELNAEGLFGATMIVGYYEQDVIFHEPMIARELLLTKENFTLDMPAVDNPGEGVVWPSSFEATYDDESESYRLTYSMATAD